MTRKKLCGFQSVASDNIYRFHQLPSNHKRGFGWMELSFHNELGEEEGAIKGMYIRGINVSQRLAVVICSEY